jgi:hypothetical protein
MDRAPAFPQGVLMGLIIGIVLAAVIWLALWRTRALNGASLQMAAAALLIGLAGYSLQGRASLAGSPAAERPARPLPPVLPVELAGEFYGRFNAATPWIVIANGYMVRGDGASAVTTLISAVRASPRNSELWIALGNGLVAQNGAECRRPRNRRSQRVWALHRNIRGRGSLRSGHAAARKGGSGARLMEADPARRSTRRVLAPKSRGPRRSRGADTQGQSGGRLTPLSRLKAAGVRNKHQA